MTNHTASKNLRKKYFIVITFKSAHWFSFMTVFLVEFKQRSQSHQRSIIRACIKKYKTHERFFFCFKRGGKKKCRNFGESEFAINNNFEAETTVKTAERLN